SPGHHRVVAPRLRHQYIWRISKPPPVRYCALLPTGHTRARGRGNHFSPTTNNRTTMKNILHIPKPSCLIAVAAAIALAGFTTTVRAQIGSGWTTDSSSHSLQKVGDVFYSNSGGVETFRLNTAD